MYTDNFEFFKALVFSLEYVIIKIEMALCWWRWWWISGELGGLRASGLSVLGFGIGLYNSGGNIMSSLTLSHFPVLGGRIGLSMLSLFNSNLIS